MSKLLPYFLLLFSISTQGFGQGSLVLLGEPIEQEGDWGTEALQWALDQTEIPTVALVGSPAGTLSCFSRFDSLQPRLVSHWKYPLGTVQDDKLVIKALDGYKIWWICDPNAQLFSDPALQTAARQHYESGGILILPASQMAHLLSVYDDFIFQDQYYPRHPQQHVLWEMALTQQKQPRQGIQLGRKVALCIDQDGKATPKGPGPISLYQHDFAQPGFRGEGLPFLHDSLQWSLLRTGASFHFRSWVSEGFSKPILLRHQGETQHTRLLLSGSDAISENDAFLEAIVSEVGKPTDPILLVGPLPQSTVETLRFLLQSKGASQLYHLHPDSVDQNSTVLRNYLIQTDKRLFMGNNLFSLERFFQGGKLGSLLQSQIREFDAFNAFMGTDSRLVGAMSWQRIGNTHQPVPALGLLQNTVIASHPYQEPPYGPPPMESLAEIMLRDSLQYGIAICPESYLHYQVIDGKAYFSIKGQRPTFVLEQGKNAALAGPSQMKSLNFERLHLRILRDADFAVGEVTSSWLTSRGSRDDWLTIYPNPFRDQLNIYFYGHQSGNYQFELVNNKDQVVFRSHQKLAPTLRQIHLPVPRLPRGVYTLEVRDSQAKLVKELELIH